MDSVGKLEFVSYVKLVRFVYLGLIISCVIIRAGQRVCRACKKEKKIKLITNNE